MATGGGATDDKITTNNPDTKEKSISNALQSIIERLDRLEARDVVQQQTPTAEATVSSPSNEIQSTPSVDVDIQRQYEHVRDRLSRVQLPSNYKVNDNSTGIKQELKPTLKVVSKTARFAETGLRQLSSLQVQRHSEGGYVLSDGDMDALYTIFAAQVNFLQSEYSALVVRSTFDEETGRLFRSFQNHSHAFSDSSLANVRIAAELSAFSRGRGSRGSNSRGPRGSSFNSFSQRRPYGGSFRRGGFHNTGRAEFPSSTRENDQL